MKIITATLALVLILGTIKAFAADPLQIYPTFWGTVATTYDLDPYVLYSIALLESRRISKKDGLVRPWPWAITVNGPKGTKPKSHYPTTKKDAKKLLKDILTKTDNVDVGLMQVNVHYHGHRVPDPMDLLDLETNLIVAGQILAEAIKSSPGELVTGVGRYHSWRAEKSLDYGYRVLTLTKNLREASNEPKTK